MSGFSAVEYRRKGSRGPASTLLFDPKRIDPAAWLSEWADEIMVKGKARSFNQYLKGRRRTDTPEGDFVKDSPRDRNFPDGTTLERVESHLRRRAVRSEVIAAARTVWRQYRRKPPPRAAAFSFARSWMMVVSPAP